MKLFKNKLAVGIICIIAALLLAFAIAPATELLTSRNITVVRASKTITEGDAITAEVLETVSVGKFNLPEGILLEPNEAIGKFATCDIQPGDYITTPKLSNTQAAENAYLLNLPDGKVAVSIELASSAAALAGKLRAGDIISIFAMPPNTQITGSDEQSVAELYGATLEQSYSISPDELKYVKVIAVTNEAEKDVEPSQQEIIISDTQNGATSSAQNTIQSVTLEVNYEQASLLAGLNGTNKLHCALVTRGNEEKANALLVLQEKIFEK